MCIYMYICVCTQTRAATEDVQETNVDEAIDSLQVHVLFMTHTCTCTRTCTVYVDCCRTLLCRKYTCKMDTIENACYYMPH